MKYGILITLNGGGRSRGNNNSVSRKRVLERKRFQVFERLLMLARRHRILCDRKNIIRESKI